MNKVLRVFGTTRLDSQLGVTEDWLTKEDLLSENADFEYFVTTVWKECESVGFYDDSDHSEGVICFYFRGE